MRFFENLEQLQELAAAHFTPDVAEAVLARSQPALGLRPVDYETGSWLFGAAKVPALQAWPMVDGRALQHTAHIALSSLPVVVPDQPETGALSFFDGYPWWHQVDFDLAKYGRVIHHDGEAKLLHRPNAESLKKAEFFYEQPKLFVVVEGPFWTAPHHTETWNLVDGDPAELLRPFFAAAREHKVPGRFIGQLFGRPDPIQSDSTPTPRMSG